MIIPARIRIIYTNVKWLSLVIILLLLFPTFMPFISIDVRAEADDIMVSDRISLNSDITTSQNGTVFIVYQAKDPSDTYYQIWLTIIYPTPYILAHFNSPYYDPVDNETENEVYIPGVLYLKLTNTSFNNKHFVFGLPHFGMECKRNHNNKRECILGFEFLEQ